MKGKCLANFKEQRPLLVLSLAFLVSGAACSKPEEEKKSAEKADGKPKIEAVQAEFNFGQVKQGQDVEHVFKVKNVGTKDLLIEKARGS